MATRSVSLDGYASHPGIPSGCGDLGLAAHAVHDDVTVLPGDEHSLAIGGEDHSRPLPRGAQEIGTDLPSGARVEDPRHSERARCRDEGGIVAERKQPDVDVERFADRLVGRHVEELGLPARKAARRESLAGGVEGEE